MKAHGKKDDQDGELRGIHQVEKNTFLHEAEDGRPEISHKITHHQIPTRRWHQRIEAPGVELKRKKCGGVREKTRSSKPNPGLPSYDP